MVLGGAYGGSLLSPVDKVLLNIHRTLAKKNRATRDIRKGEIGHCGQAGLNEYKQSQGACDFNTQTSAINPRQSRVKSTRPPLPRGYFSRAAWVAATLPGWTHYRYPETGPRLQAETTRPPCPREMPQRPLVRHRGPTQSSAKCPQLPCPRPFPKKCLGTQRPRPDSQRSPSAASSAPRGTNQHLHSHVRHQRQMKPQRRLRRLSSIHPQPAPRESPSVYLAFLSPRIRVRHWVDEGQGKGAEAVAAGAAERWCESKWNTARRAAAGIR